MSRFIQQRCLYPTIKNDERLNGFDPGADMLWRNDVRYDVGSYAFVLVEGAFFQFFIVQESCAMN